MRGCALSNRTFPQDHIEKRCVNWMGEHLNFLQILIFLQICCLLYTGLGNWSVSVHSSTKLLRKKREGNMVGWNCCQKQCIIKSLRKIFLFCTIFKNAGAIPGKGKDNWKAYIITEHVSGEWSLALVVAEKNMKSEPDAELKGLHFPGLKIRRI